MKIEVLYVAACPSHPAAVQLVRDVLVSEGVVAEICEVLITDDDMAKALLFPGSPTIRVNGRDVARESSERNICAMSCRLYPNSGQTGVSPVEWVRRAVLDAREAITS